MRRIAVVICTYTQLRIDDVRQAVASLTAQQGVEVELVVVVDHNPELQAVLSEELQRTAGGAVASVKVIANEGVRGLSDARNSGVKAATTDLVAFLDDDATGEPTWLAELVKVLEERSAHLVGGVILPNFESERPGWWPSEFDWVVGCSYPGQVPGQGFPESASDIPDAIEVRNAIGASMLARRDSLVAVGGFSTALGRVGTIPVGGEETELCIRLSRRFGQGSVWLATRSLVRHRVPDARMTRAYLHSRCYAEGLSKAVLGKLVASRSGLSSEAKYLVRVLPKAILKHIGAVFRGDGMGIARAGYIISATWMTVLGWVRGRFSTATSVVPVGSKEA